ncbi:MULTISPECIES: hypothetical protein [Amycolatopsis]|uniref:Uncharacterized protein n=1 Tax=Amycolatopsis dendrobii TaxID=2760662 RepID=A0A7W3W026_9PSEU|nr:MULTISPECIES: hypothetical protein [Amycolatopsis]MBB1156383.1 hypothetical protein [Amycolatopsis dendrobii]UKD58901.1 hypothetical protein L3Q65_19930 [Amycolatopsis sp. FU40]
MAGYKVITSALRTEAKKWDPHAEKIAGVHTAVSGMTLDTSAFWIGDGVNYLLTAEVAAIDKSAYDQLQQFMEQKLSTAGATMSHIGDVLVKAATTYAQNEKIVELELGDWSKKIPEGES